MYSVTDRAEYTNSKVSIREKVIMYFIANKVRRTDSKVSNFFITAVFTFFRVYYKLIINIILDFF